MRKGIRKAISALLVVIVIFASVPLAGFVGLELPEINLLGTKAEAATSGTCGENLTWNLNAATGELVISGTGDMYDYSVSSVTPNTPWFQYRAYIDNIIISDGVTSIGNCAFFRCESLTSITIPDSVTSIGVIAFTYCESLTSITLGNGIKTIGNSAFSFCSKLTNMTIPDSVTSIGYDLLLGCGRFKDVYFMGSEVEWNEISITSDNSNLLMSTIHFAKNISEGTCGTRLKWSFNSTTGELVISGTGRMYDYYFESTSHGNGPSPWHSVCSRINSVFVGDGVTGIGDYAFFNCYELTSITLPCSLGYINDCALGYCAVTDVYYNGTEEEWNSISIRDTNYAILEATIHFAESPIQGSCGDDLTWTLDDSTGELIISGTGDMYNYGDEVAPWFEYFEIIKSVEISDGVTSVGDCAFGGCENLADVSIGNDVTSIGYAAFTYCIGLTDVIIPDSVTSIGAGAFADCSDLISAVIGNGVITIGDGAFANCQSLTSITIPDSVTSIGQSAFYNCAFTSITVGSANTSYSSDEYGVLFNKDKTELILYPVGNERASYEIPDGITSITDYAFQYCANLTSITIPDSVTSIGENTFGSCTGLVSITIPDSITDIPYCAFEFCDNLTNAVIGNNVTSIGKGAFYDCENLASVVIPDSVTSIDNYAFNNCNSLSDIYYTGTEEEWNAISIGSYNNEPLSNATIHYNYIVPCNHSYDSEITTEVTCTENGVETFTCSKCGNVYTEVIPSNGHTRGEWEIVIESTTETEGKKIKKCLSCGETVEEAIIPRNTVITDDKTGIGVEINRDDYDGEAQVVVEETSDDSVFNIVNTETNAVRTKIYDINITVDGKETQPKGTVKVRIPLPDGYNPLYTAVYHVDTVTSTIENMDAVVETINGKMYLVFETTHFSYYAIVDKSEITMSIRTPSATTIKCGDSIVLHADLNEALPDGWKIEWIASNNNFSYSVSSDGTTCTITPSKSGDTTFTAVVCDAKGNAVSADEQTMTSKAGFFDKIIAFFKKLFGMTKVIPQAFKGIY